METLYYVAPGGAFLGGFVGVTPPADSILVPAAPDDARQIWDGSSWGWHPESGAEVRARLTAHLNAHLNAVAGQRQYDDRFTCSLRAGYAGPFQAEGQAFAAWMDACNMTAYQLMSQVKLGLAPIPTEADLIAAMPAMVWPPSPIPPDAVALKVAG